MKIYVNGIGVLGQGLPNWAAAEQVLSGRAPFQADLMPRATGEVLPAGERRRSSAVIKLAVQVAKEAVDRAATSPDSLAVVFASSSGDTDTIHHICEALATPQREVSPTRFHNSVHNAPSGYWSIATGTRHPSTSISGWDDTFAMGLIEAALQVSVERLPVLLASYDVPFPAPLAAVRPTHAAFGVAFVLSAEPAANTIAELTVTLGSEPTAEVTRMEEQLLEATRCDTAAGRSLPLLAALAARTSARLTFSYVDDRFIHVKARPWG